MMDGFSSQSPPRILWNSRKRSADTQSLDNSLKEEGNITKENQTELKEEKKEDDPPKENMSEKRRALFEPLQPIGYRTPAEELLPPPDFETTYYPKGWLGGKKRKLVNVDVVESMRRIAVQEMNRKDREIDGLNEQLEEDAKCLEHLQLQLLNERSKRAEVERLNTTLQNQISMLMNMLEDNQTIKEDEEVEAAEANAP